MKKQRKQSKQPELKVIPFIEKLELSAIHRTSWRTVFKACPDGRVKEVAILGILEFIPGKERGEFMDELYRVLIPDGKATVISAYWSTANGIHDYLYEFPPLSEQSFLYFNKKWREDQKLTDRNLKCDFDFTFGYGVPAETSMKNEETKSFYIRHYNNAVQNLQLTLTKRPE
jgi:hypothetical protein